MGHLSLVIGHLSLVDGEDGGETSKFNVTTEVVLLLIPHPGPAKWTESS
ncbi:hypothetical protein Oscil6304_2042 [Oscillatoria acuminata PCC 6304]|uniref:Uncharacterized protein n=1 Tax=Oscillatoria acuminata PCC 6304 TaxID=56110 RepID=K9TI56_9CYAN|nr:hypothetical protein Oscil6304_2042 [Oscillatoria acuminata PCC 6304]